MRDIYAILQNHFRFVTISRTQQSPLAGAHRIDVDDLISADLTRALHDLREEIRSKDKQICNYQQITHEAEQSVGEVTLIIREKDKDTRENHEKLSQAFHRFPKYEPTIRNNTRIWESCLCFVWHSSAFGKGIILVYMILMPYKKGTLWGLVRKRIRKR
jgi:hypothetical protein